MEGSDCTEFYEVVQDGMGHPRDVKHPPQGFVQLHETFSCLVFGDFPNHVLAPLGGGGVSGGRFSPLSGEAGSQGDVPIISVNVLGREVGGEEEDEQTDVPGDRPLFSNMIFWTSLSVLTTMCLALLISSMCSTCSSV